MQVTFTNTPIIRTHLIEVCPPYTDVEIRSLSATILSAAKNLAASSSLFEPGCAPSVAGNAFPLDPGGTCETCARITVGGPRENIVLDVRAVPDRETVWR